MQELYDLKEMLCKELKEYGAKGELSAGTLEIVDKLAHTVKNLDKIIEAYEEEDGYSSRSYDDSMGGSYRRSYRGSYRDGGNGGSYTRGRGRNARRDSMGRYSSDGYSRHGDIAERLRELGEEAPESTRREIERLADKMAQM